MVNDVMLDKDVSHWGRWIHAQRGRRVLSSLQTISLSCLEKNTFSWRKHYIPTSQEGKGLYTGSKETAELALGLMFSSLACFCWMTGSLSILVRSSVFDSPISMLGFVSPFVGFQVLHTKEGLGSK
uniref:Uncharacterized protein n=1 Tax=Rousettus aegyptiacus TaxID=9407 RepID=A0A7J8JFV2_ROUAE|nr:hypothetical protein HJG63_010150 [Rousettus aegyptiacus]